MLQAISTIVRLTIKVVFLCVFTYASFALSVFGLRVTVYGLL